MLVTEFDSASVEFCGLELPVEPDQMKMTWSIVGIATTTTTTLLSPGFILFYQLPTVDGFPACIPLPLPHSCAIICLFLFCRSFF
jgi:hypothetical protein